MARAGVSTPKAIASQQYDGTVESGREIDSVQGSDLPTLVIVESPAKARTISGFLGKDYLVTSSIGHIRDLPSRVADIPAAYRKKSWARTGVDVENGFEPLYIVPADKKAHVKKLKDLLAGAGALYLATDEDREGEAIAWHLKELLKPTVPVKRTVFHEITRRAIQAAFDSPRDLDTRLVDAQEARRILDRLYGYEVSPVLWRKVRPRLSAGRVQSVATRLVVDREQRRIAFRSGSYWSVAAELSAEAAPPKTRASAIDVASALFGAELLELGGQRLATGRHFDPATGLLSDHAIGEDVILLGASGAQALETGLASSSFRVKSVQEKPFTQRPHAPFITSTLQQEAGRKLGFSAQRTMRVAQRLYESGYITYMRTDSTTLSIEAIGAARRIVEELYGSDYVPDTPRSYTKKAKGAQEAHEAIRPAGEVFRTPKSVREQLDVDEAKLYDLVWKRTVASQMRDAKGQRTNVRIEADISSSLHEAVLRAHADDAVGHKRALPQVPKGPALFGASGKSISFAGYLRAYVEGADDPEAELEDREKYLPNLKEGEALTPEALAAKAHQTQAPARYTEASLVKELEERGIGRPSTYATIIQTVQDRRYVWKDGAALVPTLTAFAVTRLLTKHFSDLVDYDFTARMESDLDSISAGERASRPWLARFYYGKAEHTPGSEEDAPPSDGDETLESLGLRGLIGQGVEHIDARAVCSLEICELEGGPLMARVGRYGPYLQVGDSDQRVSIADDVMLDELDAGEAKRLIHQAKIANRELGTDPASGKTVHLKTGSYGPYVQLGEPELTPKGNIKKGSKPKMASLWPSMDIETISLSDALLLLSFPKILGPHPEGGEITVQDGKFGPYVQWKKEEGKRPESRTLEGHDHLVTIDLPAALALLATPRQNSRRANAAKALAELGQSPVTSAQIEVRDGRFGPYVTDGQVNATIPRGRDPLKITFDEALEIIAAREQRMRDQGKDPRAPKKKASSRPRKSKRSSTKK